MRSPFLRYFIGCLVLAVILGGHLAMASGPETSRLVLLVLRKDDKKPVANAHVVVHFADGKKLFFKKKQTSWEAKTSFKGKLVLDDIPQGRVTIQIIARGYQTFGKAYKFTKPEEDVTILLNPPAKQVSAY